MPGRSGLNGRLACPIRPQPALTARCGKPIFAAPPQPRTGPAPHVQRPHSRAHAGEHAALLQVGIHVNEVRVKVQLFLAPPRARIVHRVRLEEDLDLPGSGCPAALACAGRAPPPPAGPWQSRCSPAPARQPRGTAPRDVPAMRGCPLALPPRPARIADEDSPSRVLFLPATRRHHLQFLVQREHGVTGPRGRHRHHENRKPAAVVIMHCPRRPLRTKERLNALRQASRIRSLDPAAIPRLRPTTTKPRPPA